MISINKSAITVALACIVGAIVFLGGCGTTNVIKELQSNPSADLASAFSKVSTEDLDAAYADAVAHNDVLAVACYPTVKKYLGLLQSGLNDAKPIGVFSAYQKARDAQLVVGDLRIPDDLRLACAALVQDQRDFVMKMIAIAHP